MASGVVDICLIPEVTFCLEGRDGLLSYLAGLLEQRGHAVICMAEGAGQVRPLKPWVLCVAQMYGEKPAMVRILLLPRIWALPHKFMIPLFAAAAEPVFVDENSQASRHVRGTNLAQFSAGSPCKWRDTKRLEWQPHSRGFRSLAQKPDQEPLQGC